MSKWLIWEPSHPQMMGNSPESEPAKPPKAKFAGSEGACRGENLIIRGMEPAPAAQPRGRTESPEPGACPYALPKGLHLLRYQKKDPPVPVTVCSVVNDVPKFIRHAIGELDARLHHPEQIKAGDSAFELLTKLAECGLELRLDWPPERIIEKPLESEPSKPSKVPTTPEVNAQGVDITAEDVHF